MTFIFGKQGGAAEEKEAWQITFTSGQKGENSEERDASLGGRVKL